METSWRSSARESQGVTIRWALLDLDGNLTGPVDVSPPSAFMNQQCWAGVATNGDDALVCYYHDDGPLFCLPMSLDDGRPIGPVFVAIHDNIAARSLELLFAGYAYQVIKGWLRLSGQAGSYRTYEIDEGGNGTVTPFARYWVQPTQTFFAFESNTKGLVTVLRGNPLTAITSAVCRPDAPGPSCEELNAQMLDMMCGGVCDMSGSQLECCITTTFGETACGLRENMISYCHDDRTDRLACSEALAEPQTCVGPDQNSWWAPADCILSW